MIQRRLRIWSTWASGPRTMMSASRPDLYGGVDRADDLVARGVARPRRGAAGRQLPCRGRRRCP